MKPRITINLDKDGVLEILLNDAGRHELMRALSQLDEKREHFHLSTDDWTDVTLQNVAYQQDAKVIEYGKVLFRTDAWDAEHYPHVLN